MENIKKNKFTFILAIISAILMIIYIIVPSKRTIKDIEIKKISKDVPLVKIQSYYVENSTLKPYLFETVEDSYSNLLKTTVKDILIKSFPSAKINIVNIYFSDDSVYFELDNKNINSNLKEAIIKTTTELLGISDIKFI